MPRNSYLDKWHENCYIEDGSLKTSVTLIVGAAFMTSASSGLMNQTPTGLPEGALNINKKEDLE